MRSFNYRIYNNSGISKPIAVYQENRIRLNDPFLSYSFYANRLVEGYISVLQSPKVERLNHFLSFEKNYIVMQNSKNF